MSLRTPTLGVVCQTTLALAGFLAGAVLADWPLATACFAACAATAVIRAREAERAARDVAAPLGVRPADRRRQLPQAA